MTKPGLDESNVCDAYNSCLGALYGLLFGCEISSNNDGPSGQGFRVTETSSLLAEARLHSSNPSLDPTVA